MKTFALIALLGLTQALHITEDGEQQIDMDDIDLDDVSFCAPVAGESTLLISVRLCGVCWARLSCDRSSSMIPARQTWILCFMGVSMYHRSVGVLQAV